VVTIVKLAVLNAAPWVLILAGVGAFILGLDALIH
jgi:hypothetical protein